MQILDSVIILALLVLAFIAGLKLAGHYYTQVIAEIEYASKILAGDKGLGYIAPPAHKEVVPIGQEFMDRLRTHGHATQALRTTHH